MITNHKDWKNQQNESRTELKKYKLRAECAEDFKKLAKLMGSNIMSKNVVKPDAAMPDVEVTFESDLSLKDIKDIIAKVQDGHVMKDTIKPINSYTGIRESNATNIMENTQPIHNHNFTKANHLRVVLRNQLTTEMSAILPTGFTWAVKKWGNSSYLKINTTEGKTFKFNIGQIDETMTAKRIVKMVKAKLKLNESAETGQGILEEIVYLDWFKQYVNDEERFGNYNLDSDTNIDNEPVAMMYMQASDVKFDLSDKNAPEFEILTKKLEEYLNTKHPDIYPSEVTVTTTDGDGEIVFAFSYAGGIDEAGQDNLNGGSAQGVSMSDYTEWKQTIIDKYPKAEFVDNGSTEGAYDDGFDGSVGYWDKQISSGVIFDSDQDLVRKNPEMGESMITTHAEFKMFLESQMSEGTDLTKLPGIETALSEFDGNAKVVKYMMDPGYGYGHVFLALLKFEDGQYGLCIYDSDKKEFIEEPANLEEYNMTTDRLFSKYPALRPDEMEEKFAFKTPYTREELGKGYEEVVGYDISKDDPSMTAEDILKLMMEYDAEGEDGVKFAKFYAGSTNEAKSKTIGELNNMIASNNKEYGTEFSITGAYGQHELWAKTKDGSERIESGSKQDIYQAFVRSRFKEKYTINKK